MASSSSPPSLSSSTLSSPSAENSHPLNELADKLQAEVAERYNMSVEDYLSGLGGVWQGSQQGAGKGNGSEGAGEEREISDGIAWTLVAPLILLALLVAVGVTVACLWKLKDRRCCRGNLGSEMGAGEQGGGGGGGGGSTTGDIEMQELNGEFRRSLPGPVSNASLAGRAPGGADLPQGLLHGDLPSSQRFRQTTDSEGRPLSHHPPPSYPGGGAQDKKVIQVHGQAGSDSRVMVTPGSEKIKLLTARRNGQDTHKPLLEAQTRVKGAHDIDLYCGVCQHYITQSYPHDERHFDHHYPGLYHTVPRHQPRSGLHHEPHSYLKSAGSSQPHRYCRECADHHSMPRHHHNHHHHHHHHQRVMSQSHETSLHRAHERDRVRRVSQSLDDHLHLVPRYQPPDPGYHTPQPFADYHLSPLQQYRHTDRDTAHGLSPDPNTSHSHKNGSCHGLENPLFVTDSDDENTGCSESRRDVSSGKGGSKRAKEEEKDQERRDTPHIINSTSMMSTFGDSDPTGSGHTQQGRRHSATRGGKSKPVVRGPDVSSIKMISSTSQAWHRTSGRLLPSSTTVISSHTTSSISNRTTNTSSSNDDNEEEEEEEDLREETLSLPSSISRFHASRVQFPPLMPDAQYPLTSTKTFFSPSLPAPPPDGEGQASWREENVLETLETFSDNTSLQPNVGSSVTSGQISDLRGSQSRTVSSSVSDPWADPTHLTRQPSSVSLPADKQDASSEAERRQTDDALSNKTMALKHGSGNLQSHSHNVDGHNGGEGRMDSDFPDSYGKATHRKSEPSSLHVPSSATELRRERMLKGAKRKEKAKSEHKQGFFLIPRQDRKSGTDLPDHQQPVVEASEAGVNVSISSRNLGTSSRRQVVTRPPHNRKSRVSMAEERVGHWPLRQPSATTTNFLNCPGDGFSSKAHHKVHPESKSPLSEERGTAAEQRPTPVYSVEQHPTKLYSCKTSSVRADPRCQYPNQETAANVSEFHLAYKRKGRNVGESSKRNERSNNHQRSTANPFPELVAFKASSMSASFPSVSVGPVVKRPAAATLDHWSSKSSRTKLKRTKSYEDHVYINMGGSFFDEMLQNARNRHFHSSVAKSRAMRDGVPNSNQPTCLSQQLTPSQAEHTTPRRRDTRQRSHSSRSRTESQIMADILKSFPQNAVPQDSNVIKQDDKGKENMGTVYTDVTIPTAFADELFGFWTLTPELDEDLSQPAPDPPLMTPLKEEARMANRKFIWGNSGSPSGSTSTSSVVPAMQHPDDPGDRSTRHLSHPSCVEDVDDYVQMDKNSSNQPRSSSQQMSISDPPSTGTVPPTPSVTAAEGNVGQRNVNTGSTVEEHTTLPVDNVKTSTLFVFAGKSDNNNNNNNTRSNLVGMDNSAVNITAASPPLTTGSLTSADAQNSNTAFASGGVVLTEQKYWL